MSRTPDGPPPAPVAQRLRIRYAKRGRLRFTSHRDFQRAFERAVRRAGLPIAFSAGFTPHPKISYAGAAPTGVSSEAEYLEIGLTEHRDPAAVAAALAGSLPVGLDIVEVVRAGPGALADRIDASLWRIDLPGCCRRDAEEAVAAFLTLPEAPVERLTKDGKRRLDARAPVVSMAVSDDAPTTEPDTTGPCAILQVVVRQVTPAVRPDDVVTALRQVAERVPPLPAVRVTRLAQGLLGDDGRIADPLAADREASGVPAGVAGATPTS